MKTSNSVVSQRTEVRNIRQIAVSLAIDNPMKIAARTTTVDLLSDQNSDSSVVYGFPEMLANLEGEE